MAGSYCIYDEWEQCQVSFFRILRRWMRKERKKSMEPNKHPLDIISWRVPARMNEREGPRVCGGVGPTSEGPQRFKGAVAHSLPFVRPIESIVFDILWKFLGSKDSPVLLFYFLNLILKVSFSLSFTIPFCTILLISSRF